MPRNDAGSIVRRHHGQRFMRRLLGVRCIASIDDGCFRYSDRHRCYFSRQILTAVGERRVSVLAHSVVSEFRLLTPDVVEAIGCELEPLQHHHRHNIGVTGRELAGKRRCHGGPVPPTPEPTTAMRPRSLRSVSNTLSWLMRLGRRRGFSTGKSSAPTEGDPIMPCENWMFRWSRSVSKSRYGESAKRRPNLSFGGLNQFRSWPTGNGVTILRMGPSSRPNVSRWFLRPG